jgi:hypothetical protein
MTTNEMPCCVKVRAMWCHEDGYCLAAPEGLRKDSNAVFASYSEGKIVKLEPVPGCEGRGDAQVVIHLKPWTHPALGKQLALLACYYLGGSRKGDARARAALQWCLGTMIAKCLRDEDRAAGLLNLIGAARIEAELNANAWVKVLHLPTGGRLVEEAFGWEAAA